MAQDRPENKVAGADGPRRRGRVLRLAALVLLLAVVLPLGVLWARLAIAPLALPDAVQARISAQANGAMMTGAVEIGDVVIALPDGGIAPALVFRDVSLTGPSGDARAAFPFLRVRLAPGPLLRGQVRVANVVISGAGVNLRRSVDGRLGLDFAGDSAAAGPPVSLVETLARLDRMVTSPIFSRLDAVQGVGLTVRLSDDVTGRDLRLLDAGLRLTHRDGRLDLVVGGQLDGSRDAALRIALSREAAEGRTQARLSFDTLAARDLAASTPALAWLDLMRAPIDGSLNGAMADDGTIGAVQGELTIGAGQLTLPGQSGPVPFNAMAVALDYDPDRRRVRFDRLALEADQLAFTATGHADISADDTTFTGQFTLGDIRAAPDGMFDAPVVLDGAAIDLRLHLGDTVRVEVGQAVVFDGDLRAVARGHLSADPAGLTLSVDAGVEEVDVATILSLWPVEAIPTTRRWVSERLLAATAHGVDFALRRAPGAAPDFEVSFDFSGARIRPFPAAPVIEGAEGYFSLHNTVMQVGLTAGGIAAEGQGAVALAGSRMGIDDVSVRGPLARFDIAVAGEVPDLMHVLAGPPFAVLSRSALGPDEIGTGRIAARATLATRLVARRSPGRMADLAINAEGQVTGFRADRLVPDRVLTSDRMALTMTPEVLSIAGPAALDGIPLTGQWRVRLGPDATPGSLVEARVPLSREALAAFGVALPEWLFSGAGQADLTVALQADRPAILTVASDLEGIALAIPPLAWTKAPDRGGTLAATVRLGPDPAVTELAVQAAGLTLDGAMSFTPDRTLDRLSASSFRLGQWLDVQGALVGRGAAGPAIEVSGGVLDFRTMPSLAGSGGASGDVGPLTIALDRMQITGGIALTDMRADLDGGSMSGNFRGLVNDAAQVVGQLVPGANGPSIRLSSDDGGAVMRAAGIFENLHGGPLDLTLNARPERGQYDGRATIAGPRLRDAPVMAELLNAVSVIGLLEQLSGDGINMGEVNAAFRIAPDRITVTEGTALGPSIGISMDGVYDVASRRYEMQGVVSPFYVVNGLLGALFAPRREGLFGFNYRLTGNAEDTRVSVNPLSILTPGIFREIFRAPAPDFSGAAPSQ